MGNAPRSVHETEIVASRIVPRNSQLITNSISIAPDIYLEVHLLKNSFKIQKYESLYSLSFKFDSLHVCLITIYYFGVEVLTKTEDHTSYFSVETSKFPLPCSYKFPKGLNQGFPESVSTINFDLYAVDISNSESQNSYPIIITIKSDKAECFPYESSFLRLEREKDMWKPLLIKQKIHFENSSYLLEEIYGLSIKNLEENECIVCFTGRSTVTMMPCKHLCLCEECARILGESTIKRCPMCRTGNL